MAHEKVSCCHEKKTHMRKERVFGPLLILEAITLKSRSDFKKAIFYLNQSQTPSMKIEPITNVETWYTLKHMLVFKRFFRFLTQFLAISWGKWHSRCIVSREPEGLSVYALWYVIVSKVIYRLAHKRSVFSETSALILPCPPCDMVSESIGGKR